jgi:hypothetical protein
MKEHLIKLMDKIFWPAVFVALIMVVFVFFPLSVEFFSSQASTNISPSTFLSFLQQTPDPDVSETVCVTTGGGEVGDDCPGCPPFVPDILCTNVPAECICCSCGCIRPFITGGNGKKGYAGDNSLALNAQLNFPSSVAYDPIEKVTYVADTQNFVIRKINSSGVITTLAGNPGSANFTNPNGVATQASLGKVKALALNRTTKELFFASEPNVIAKLSLIKPVVTTITEGGKSSPAIGATALGALLGQIQALVLDSQGNLYAATTNGAGGGRIYQISQSGQITAIFGQDTQAPRPGETNGDQGQASLARFGLITDLALDQLGNIYLTDVSQMLIRKINLKTNIVTTFLGGGREKLANGVLAQNAQLTEEPRSIIVDQAGQLYFATIAAKGNIYQVDTSGIVQLIVGGRIRYPEDNNPLTKENFLQIGQMDVDAEGKLYFTDVLANQVFKLDPTLKLKPSSNQEAKKPTTIQPKLKVSGGISNLANPMAPSNLSASVNGASVSLSWTDNAQGQFGFVVERKITSDGTFNVITTVPSNQTTYVDNASSNTSYCYQIRLNIPKIESVLFEKLDGTALDKNPTLGNEVTVNGKKLGGGVRFFPDATTPLGQPQKLKVKAKITPAQKDVPIYFRSYDVDDSSGLFSNSAHTGQDNQGPTVRNDGIALEGKFDGFATNATVSAMTDTSGIASVTFIVTMQPGDNFKVVATTDQNLINNMSPLSISGQDILDSTNNNMPLPKQPDMTEPPVMPAKALTSQLLTVWRYVHVEVDAMKAPFSPNMPSTNLAEINYIKGNIEEIGILQGQKNLFFQGFVTDQVLRDSSFDFETTSQGDGRFENGSITVGQNFLTNVAGNGSKTAFVGPFMPQNVPQIPCELVDKKGNKVTGGIIQMTKANSQNNTPNSFVLLGNIKSPGQYNGGKVTVAGVTFTLDKINANMNGTTTVELDSKVQQPPFLLPFILFDDDQKTASTLTYPQDFQLMQTSDSTQDNLFATTYIKPIFDLPSSTSLPFKANIVNGIELTDQISTGKNNFSTNNFWVLYIQAGWQGSTNADMDPDELARGITLGQTPGATLVNLLGSVISLETTRDTAVTFGPSLPHITQNLLNKITTVHECGHQFGAPDRAFGSNGGIMEEIPLKNSKYTNISSFAFFVDRDQQIIRTRPKPTR